MYLTDLLNKKIINIYDGELLGQLGEADLLIDERNGCIEAVVIQENRKPSFKNSGAEKGEKQIPWSAVKKIGGEIIVIDYEML